MDKTDIALLQILSKNASVTATELTSKVNLSVPAINKRISKLKATGIIRRATILTDPKQVGKPITAFVLVVLDRVGDADGLTRYVQDRSRCARMLCRYRRVRLSAQDLRRGY